jgi:predicted DsbA family dithiol-disulfide isomerase
MQLVIYGDFNCPFSALASNRGARLERAGAAAVDWRAVAHDLEIPVPGGPVDDTEARALEAEIEQVRGLLLPDETLELGVPPVRSNTVAATDAYAAAEVGSRPQTRRALFCAYWEQGQDLADPTVLATMGLTAHEPTVAAGWREEWLAFDRPLVPIMRLPDGYVSRGLGALARLADLLGEAAA